LPERNCINTITVPYLFYFKTFYRYNLANPHSQGLGAPVQGPGLGNGQLNYTRVCSFIKSGATKEYDVYGQVPFAYKDYDWIAYENELSLAVKARWAAKAGIGGVTLYALNFDDWAGNCRPDKKTFPLTRSVSRTLELASIRSYRQYDADKETQASIRHYTIADEPLR